MHNSNRISSSTNREWNRRHTWEEFVETGLTIALLHRLEHLQETVQKLGIPDIQDVGILEIPSGRTIDSDGVACNFGGKYDSFLRYIEEELKLDFFSAVQWLLDFIQQTPSKHPENTDCRCDEEGLVCDHA